MSMSMLSRALRAPKLNAVRSTVRHGGDYLKKNIWIEENAGLRENTYKTWQFNMSNSIKIFSFLVFPGVLFFFACIEEEKKRDKHIGRERLYGALPRKID